MKTILLALLLCFSIVIPVGCATNTATATVKADKSVVKAANATLDLWADWYVSQRKKANGDPTKLAALQQQKVLVDNAWKQYQATSTAIVLAQRAKYANVTNGTIAQITGSITAAALPFLELVTSLTKK